MKALWVTTFVGCVIGVLACGESTEESASSSGTGGSAPGGASGGALTGGGASSGEGGGATANSGGSPSVGGASATSTGGSSGGNIASGGSGGASGGDGSGGGGGASTGGDGSVGGACGCVESAVSWGRDGGMVIYAEASALSPCARFSHTRTPMLTDPPEVDCAQDLECPGEVMAEAVALALAHSDVRQALAAAPVVYGVDSRPVDGQVWRFTVGGASVDVGGPCAGASQCNPIPEGVQALMDLLTALTAQELARGECAAAFPEGA